VRLRHAVLVVAEVSDVRALLGDGHGGRGGVDAEGGDEGEDGGCGIRWGGFEDWEEEEAEEGRGEVVNLDSWRERTIVLLSCLASRKWKGKGDLG
jgi:hypothetical protein